MTEMVRKQIYMPKRQQTQVKRAAQAQGVSEAEYIRRAIDQQLASGTKGFPPDSKAWDRAMSIMEGLLAEAPVPNRRRSWTREDLYEEREARYVRHNR
jgi:hypothetical protein